VLRLRWKVGLLLHGQNSKQRLVAVPKRCREAAKLSQPSGDRTRQGSAKAFQIRVRLRRQKPKQQLADVPERRRQGYEPGQPNGDRHNKSAKGVAHPSAVTRPRTKTATGRCAKEASGWQRTRTAEQHQNAASQQNALHSRAQLHGQEPKQQLADVPNKRRDGDELGQANSIRARLVSAIVLNIRA